MSLKHLPSAAASLSNRVQPVMDRIPVYPTSWYLYCPTRQLRSGPVSKKLFDRELVAFRTASGHVSVMDSRCVHMGADLGQGRVVGETLQCPFHHWQFGVDGQCVNIPAAKDIPNFARQACFPVEQRHGSLFFFNAQKPLFPLPFFSGCEPSDLVPAKPFTAVLECPWYMVGANAVDLQHFSAAHDRRLKEHPTVELPAPYAHRTTATFAVEGRSLSDRLTRRFAGDEVTMEMTDWGGTLMFVRATFRHAQSFGMLASLPLGPRRTLAKVTVFTRRSDSRLGRAFVDPLNVWIRRLFIRKFLNADVPRLAGTQFNPNTTIEIDQLMVEYFQWLASLRRSPTGESAKSNAGATVLESSNNGNTTT